MVGLLQFKTTRLFDLDPAPGGLDLLPQGNAHFQHAVLEAGRGPRRVYGDGETNVAVEGAELPLAAVVAGAFLLTLRLAARGDKQCIVGHGQVDVFPLEAGQVGTDDQLVCMGWQSLPVE